VAVARTEALTRRANAGFHAVAASTDGSQGAATIMALPSGRLEPNDEAAARDGGDWRFGKID
jgi:hypothetical protein